MWVFIDKCHLLSENAMEFKKKIKANFAVSNVPADGPVMMCVSVKLNEDQSTSSHNDIIVYIWGSVRVHPTLDVTF